jgi:malate synthase
MIDYAPSRVVLSADVTAAVTPETAAILTPRALEFVATLERAFGGRRRELLAQRVERQRALDAGELPNFLPDTAEIRAGEWQIAPVPTVLQKRWVEITGPTDRKMVINALNSGADVFMADFEDANSPTWENMTEGQINLKDAINRRIDFTAEDTGKKYRLNPEVATLFVRPRGLHLEEGHMHVAGRAVSASLFDFGLYFFHNAQRLLDMGAGPFFYLAKLESHLEARWWNDVFVLAQDELGIPQGTIKATVLIETIMAAFEMDEILYELREHSAGLNAGRWDYIFSCIKKFRNQANFIMPDRSQITMTVPFMHGYSELLIKTCHKRGAHAMGGMSAFIPNRREPEVTRAALAKVTADKERESRAGHDGSWVAHPDLVPMVQKIFAEALAHHPNQIKRQRDEVQVTAVDLLNWDVPGGSISEEGLRTNINVGLLYLESWLRGTGAAALYNLMEDTATAEISRAQVWQWIQHPEGKLPDGRKITADLVREMMAEELDKIEEMLGTAVFRAGQFQRARDLFDKLVTANEFIEFLTLPGYKLLD